jgi:ATP-binding cassette, subfamily C, bacterial CydCD
VKPLDPRLLRHASAARRFVGLTAALAVATAGLVLVQAELLARGIDGAFLGAPGSGSWPRCWSGWSWSSPAGPG